MNYTGFLNIYKEKGMTSMSVCARIRRILHVDKVGHAGTLDPMAEGVLPVALGRACKSAASAGEGMKIYEAGMLLGTVTDTQDITGKTVSVWEKELPAEEEIRRVIAGFLGGYDQLTPMYSARQVGGQRLYDIARSGKEAQRERKHIDIRSIEVTEIRLPHVRFTVECSKGTYVRTICHDIGERLGCGACMESLLRTQVGSFSLKDALSFSDVEELERTRNVDSALRVVTPTAVAIGKFDGTHKGHQALLRELRKTAEQQRLRSLVLLISSGTDRVEDREDQRTRLLSMGIDYVIEMMLTPEVREMRAEQFLKEVLIGRLSMKYLVGGRDISFGCGKEGNEAFLKAKAPEYGFHFRLIDKVRMSEISAAGTEDPDAAVSSTILHDQISAGNMGSVRQIMGKYYDFRGRVIPGKHIGTDVLGFPTANQSVDSSRCLPPFGVYVSRITLIGTEDRKYRHDLTAPKGKNFRVYCGISNLGRKPSVSEGDAPVLLETHLLDGGPVPELYGQEIVTELLCFLRPERKFGSLGELREQIRDKDIPAALRELEAGGYCGKQA